MKCNFALAAAVVLVVSNARSAEEPAPVTIKVEKGHIDFLAGKDLVARYHTRNDLAKPHFWPVNGPGGVAVTRDWPMLKGLPDESSDHIHQKSAWFCHGDVIPEGVELKKKIKGVDGADFWSEAPNHGRMECVQVSEPKLEKNHGAVVTRNEWRTADGQKILDETRTIHLYNFGDTRLIVLDVDLAANDVPVVFGDTKEGSMGVRVNDSITEAKKKGRIENAEGKVGEKECWGQISPWCDYSGQIDGKTVGIALLADPANPYPCCWHSRGYGLMAANPFGRTKAGFPAMKANTDLARLNKGKHLKLRFGILIHPGDAKEGKVADYFEHHFAKLKG